MATKNPRTKNVAYYVTTTPGTYIEVDVHYGSGGYALTFTPTKLSVSLLGFHCSEFVMFSGTRLKVEPAPRFNAARLAKIAALAYTLPDYTPTVEALAAKEGLVLTGEKLDKKAAFALAPVKEV